MNVIKFIIGILCSSGGVVLFIYSKKWIKKADALEKAGAIRMNGGAVALLLIGLYLIVKSIK